MFVSLSKEVSTSKCYVSRGALPSHFDPKQLPRSKKPFSTILNQPFTHTVDLVLPEEMYSLVWKDVEPRIPHLQYSRVMMALSDLLEGDFFNTYIKTGNILMLSEGRPGIDNLYTLKDGTLRLELGKESYERCGLPGMPVRDGGRKHVKTRYAIEINLRLPSMLHGKKGFERIVWAFKNVLKSSVTWLFYDFQTSAEGTNTRKESAFPCDVSSEEGPQTTSSFPRPNRSFQQPDLRTSPHHQAMFSKGSNFEDWAIDLHEWISLVILGSPRILKDDTIDPFLCRYAVPDDYQPHVSGVALVQWSGLIPAFWIRQLLIELSDQYSKKEHSCLNPWFALSGNAFHTELVDSRDGYTILRAPGKPLQEQGAFSSSGTALQGFYGPPRQDFILWEFSQASEGRS